MRGDQINNLYQRLAARTLPGDLAPDSWMQNPTGSGEDSRTFLGAQSTLHAPGQCTLLFDSIAANPYGQGDELEFKALKYYPTGFTMVSYLVPVAAFVKLARQRWGRNDESVPEAHVKALKNIAHYAPRGGATQIDLAFGG